MIDTDDLDRTLRAAFVSAAELDAPAEDAAARVAVRVTRRRHRRIATRVAAALLVVVLTVAAVNVVTTRDVGRPAHKPAPTYATPAILLKPQTAADRTGIAVAKNFKAGIVPASVHLLATSGTTRVFGALDSAIPCVIVVGPERDSSATGCSAHIAPGQRRQGEVRFTRVGASIAGLEQGIYTIAMFVPDTVRIATVNGATRPITRDGFLLVLPEAQMPPTISLSSAHGTVRLVFTVEPDDTWAYTTTGSFD